MARSIESSDAKKIISTHNTILTNIEKIRKAPETYKSNVIKYADEYIIGERLSALKEIPIEELNRSKQGFRIKTLRDNGYTSIADTEKVTASTLAKIGGISMEAAQAIKKASREIAKLSSDSVHLKLSLDNKSPAATNLADAVSKYIFLQNTTATCEKLSAHRKSIVDSINLTSPLTSGIKWLFTSKEKKADAEKAYAYLQKLLASSYGTESRNCSLEFNRIVTASKDNAWVHFGKNPVLFYNILEALVPHLIKEDTTVYGLPEELARAIAEEPMHLEGLKCTLRRYQEWGVKYSLHQKKVLLGDEMGLGKTVQAIATMVSLRNTGGNHFVVVCPASVITNWCREIEKMSDLEVTKVHGSDRDASLQYWKENGGVAVTTYETTEHFTLSDKFKYSMIVVDEAHYIKNPDAQRSKNVRNLCNHANRIMFMTGTALENKVSEMISLMGVLSQGVAKSVEGMQFLSSAPEFREKVAPVYYRRRREDVLTELPELIENTDWCTMGEAETMKYREAVLSGNFAAARRVSFNVDDLKDSSKAQRLLEIVEDAKEDGRKVIVFSFFLDTIGKIKALLGDVAMEPINGSVSPQRRQEIIDEFQNAPAGSVLAAQIQSGGTGLNIQTASVVVLCEPQFKPSIENQAISRAYRMGQTRNVLVHRLLCDETVDERISDLLRSKQEIFDAFADESSVGAESLELDEKSFSSIMEEERKRILGETPENQKTPEGSDNPQVTPPTESQKAPETTTAPESQNTP